MGLPPAEWAGSRIPDRPRHPVRALRRSGFAKIQYAKNPQHCHPEKQPGGPEPCEGMPPQLQGFGLREVDPETRRATTDKRREELRITGK